MGDQHCLYPVRAVAAQKAGVALAFAALTLTVRANAQDTGSANPPPPLPPAPPGTATEPIPPPSTPQFDNTKQPSVKPPPLTIDRVRAAKEATAKQNADAAKGPEKKGRPVTVENADEFTVEDNERIITLRGNVRVSSGGYTIAADKIRWDRQQNFMTAEGKVTVTGTPYPVYADYARINVRTEEFTTRNGRTIVPAENIGSQIVQPVFISGETLSRIGVNYNATNGLLTTCDFPNPHFKIGFRQMDIIPNDRIVLRDNIIYRYDQRKLRIKYLTFPIREERRFSYVPEFGRTNEEGYYVKAALGYALSRVLPGILRVDVLQKKGVGLGFDQAYQLNGANAVGTLALYGLNDRSRGASTYNGRVNHQQYLGDVLATLTSDFQTNSYQALTDSSRTSNSTLNLDRPAGKSRSTASLTYGRSDYGPSKSDTVSYALSQAAPFGADGSVTFRLNGSDQTSRSEFGGTSSLSGRSDQSADIKATGRLGVFDADLSANKNVFIHTKGSSGGASFSGTQRLPDFLLSTDMARLFGGDRNSGLSSGGLTPPRPQKNPAKNGTDPTIKDDGKIAQADDESLTPAVPKESAGSRIARLLPFRLSLGYGRFLENVTRFDSTSASSTVVPVTTNRLLFNMETSGDPQFRLTRGGGLTLSTGGGFKQTVYSADAAQYILTGRSVLRQRLGETSALNLNYNYQRPYGGTPSDFRLDRIGNYNNAALNLNVDTYRTRLGVSTGYDFERAGQNSLPGFSKNPWQNLSAQLGLRPSTWFQTRFTTTYDINHGKWLDLTNRMRFRGKNYFALDTSLRYDPLRDRFPQATSALTVPLFSQTVFLNALNGYNGVTSKFDYQRYSISWGFHDYEYLFSFVDQPYGFRTERGFNFTIRLRALPQVRASTTGQYGTAIDTGSGEVF